MYWSSEIVKLADKSRPHDQRRTTKFKTEVVTADAANPNVTSRQTTESQCHNLEQGWNASEVFEVLQEHSDAADEHGWTQGTKLFQTFKTLVRTDTVARNEWQIATDSVNSRSVANFVVAKQTFLRALLPDLKYAAQLEYMRSLTKPGPMSVNDFRRDFKYLNDITAKFPDANGATGLDNDEFKRVFFQAMPKAWRVAFEGAGFREHSATLQEIADYMKMMEQLHPFETRPARTSTSGNGSSTNASSTGAHQLSRRNRNNISRGNQNNSNGRSRNQSSGRSNSGNRANSNGNRTPPIRPEDTCPLPGHGNHKWYDCTRNARGRHGDNTERPATTSNGNGSGNGNGGGQRGRPNRGESNTVEAAAEAHYIQDLSNVEDDYLDQVDDLDAELYCIECNSDADEDSDDDSVPALIKRDYIDSDDESEDSGDEESYDSVPELMHRSNVDVDDDDEP